MFEDMFEGIGNWASNFEIKLPFLDAIAAFFMMISQPLLAVVMVVAWVAIWVIFIGSLYYIGKFIVEYLPKAKEFMDLVDKELGTR